MLQTLLENGIISTAMIRNLKEGVTADDQEPVNVLNNKFKDAAIYSVEKSQKRYGIAAETLTIQSKPSNHDALSPHWFLDEQNSMGALKEDIDLTFGEAIVEFRAIRNIQPYFLNKVNLLRKLTAGQFLALPEDNGFKDQALGLFEYLKKFDIMQVIGDIYLGITKAVSKY